LLAKRVRRSLPMLSQTPGRAHLGAPVRADVIPDGSPSSASMGLSQVIQLILLGTRGIGGLWGKFCLPRDEKEVYWKYKDDTSLTLSVNYP
jgi:hypothetical protein